MKKTTFLLFSLLFLWSCGSKYEYAQYIEISQDDTPQVIAEKAAHVIPSQRQLDWQDMEYTAFCHFGINTFTNREWGDGREDPAWFNPTAFDARQWVSTFQQAGMKMVIVTSKHHDGFCLWPSATTDHSVKRSPWLDGKGDVVGAVKEACEEFGLKFGVYLSPWDRHEQSYGTDAYNDFFVNQLTELLTQYGQVDEVWFDGANGEGPNGKRQVYDWMRYYQTIRDLQPQAVIAVMGPDVRWVGTESGYGRVMEWSVVPYEAMDTGEIAASSQQAVTDGVFVPMGDKMARDLGSRNKIKDAKALVWYPSEVDVSIRPGWFYHPDQDDQVKSVEKLLDIWFSSVGRNSLLLLNVPPDTRGLIHERDVEVLLGLAAVTESIFGTNLADQARVKATSQAIGKKAANILVPGREKFWMARQGDTYADIELEFPEKQVFDCLTLSENIELGQRIEQFSLEVWQIDRWKEVTRSTTIGNKRILRFSPQEAQKVRLRILQSRYTPTLAFFGLHKRQPHLELQPPTGAFMEEMEVEILTDRPENQIFYTLDGTEPDEQATRYNEKILLTENTRIRALAIDPRGVRSFLRNGHYTLATFTLNFATPPSPKYPGATQITLFDGQTGSTDFASGDWLGWEGEDMVLTIDLGETGSYRKVSAGFLSALGSWIFMPRALKVEYSEDGQRFRTLGTATNPDPWDVQEGTFRKEFSVSGSMQARYFRITGVSQKVCPPGHAGEGGKAWLFADEITIE